MKRLSAFCFVVTGVVTSVITSVTGQSPPADSSQATLPLSIRMSQLMESTAVAVPDLIGASQALRQLAGNTITSLRAAPRNPALVYRLINQVRAYLALADSFPPTELPPAAIQQFGELREDLARLQQRFEIELATQEQTIANSNSDPNDLKRYSEANTKLLPLGAIPRVVFLGDSITDAWRLNEYFTGRDFVNRGISGQTSGQMLGRFMQDVVKVHPKAVVIMAGTNDVARGIPANAVEDELRMMGDLAKAHGIKPLFGSILPVSDYHKDQDPQFERSKTRPPTVIRQINSWMKDYCQREQVVYIDYFTALADGIGQMPADLSDDGLHPNAKGYRVMSPVALDAINRALAATTSPAPSETPSRRRFGLPGGNKKSDSPTP